LKELLCFGVGKDIVIQEDEFSSAIHEQIIESGDLPVLALLKGNDTEGTMKRTTAGNETNGSISELQIQTVVCGHLLDFRRKTSADIHPRSADKRNLIVFS
jgi:hypothetical protein